MQRQSANWIWIKRVNGCDGKVELKYKLCPSKIQRTRPYMRENRQRSSKNFSNAPKRDSYSWIGLQGERRGAGVRPSKTRKMIEVEVINTKQLTKRRRSTSILKSKSFRSVGQIRKIKNLW